MDLPNRKSIRLRDYDYSQNGGYFITICTEQRQEVLGQISVGVGRDQPEIILNKQGQIVLDMWKSLPNHHPVVLDTFQIMPNHIHFILFIKTGASRYGLTGASRHAPTGFKPTLGFIIGSFKTEATKQINRLGNTPGKTFWQRNYYEHIIRNELELFKIQDYIENNPLMWNRDRNNPEAKKDLTPI